jgi:hypothetical protein
VISRIIIALTVLAAVLASRSGADAAELDAMEMSGYAALDVRAFANAPLHAAQGKGRINPSLVLRPELSWQWNGGDDRIDIIPFARLDSIDVKRRHADARELKYSHFGEDWDIKVGFDKVFWGVTESRHLVDIINQTDAVEDIDGEDKLGQPMVNLGLQRDWGDINLIAMPTFRERSFAGPKGRPGASPVVDTDRAFYENSLGRHHPDLALRYSTVIGDWDLGLSHFHGTSREPSLVADTNDTGASIWVPRYDIIEQSGLDVQVTLEEWLWKMEGIVRSGQGKRFAATTVGLEYSFFGLIDEAGDLGLLAEYHYDGRDGNAPSTAYDNDLFVGLRLTLNDIDDTNFLAGVLVDRITQARIFSAEADTRLSDDWTLEAELRITNSLTDKDPAFGARRDSHLQVRLARYF